MTKQPVASGTVTVNDGMANVAAGLGAVNAKTQHIYAVHNDPHQLEMTYRGSTWFRKIVDTPATDSTRAWRQWNAKTDDITKIEKTEKRLQLKRKVRDALILQRLLGGAVIIPTGLPGNSEKPLRMESISVDSIKSLTLLNRYQVQTEGVIEDINSPWHGQPKFYVINDGDGRSTKIHPSRVARFSERRFTHQNTGDDGWGDSIWLRMSDSIQNSETGAAVLTALLTEAKIDIVQMPDLATNMSTERQEQALIRRFNIATQLKSITNTLLMDKDDQWTQKTVNFSNLPETVLTLLQIMCGAASMPMTKLLGSQAKGLNNGGDIDLKIYYDDISSDQELELDPAMAGLNEMLVRSALGRYDDTIWHTWSPLYQMSEKEESEVEERYAKTAETLVNTGLFPPDALQAAVADRMINSGSWPALEAALRSTKQKAEEVERGANNYEPTEEELARQAEIERRSADPDEDDDEATDAALNDATPRSLYVRRDLLNGDAVLAWAREAGFTDLVDPAKMHVTLAYSKMPLDWMKAGEDWNANEDGSMRVGPGGVRLLEAFGTEEDEGKAVVLLFTSSALTWRHEQIKRAGAQWKHDDYQPHITISWSGIPAGMDLSAVKAYQGELLFGPEVFEEIDPDWKANR